MTQAKTTKRKSADDVAWGSKGKEARYLGRFRRFRGGRRPAPPARLPP